MELFHVLIFTLPHKAYLKAYRSIFTDVLQIWKQSQEVHGAKAHRPWIPFWIRTWLHR